MGKNADQILEKNEYLSPTPTLLICHNNLVDFNIAAKLLFGSNIVRFRNKTINQFFREKLVTSDDNDFFVNTHYFENHNHFSARVDQPANDIPQVVRNRCLLNAGNFKNTELYYTALPRLNNLDDAKKLTYLYFEIVEIADPSGYHERIKKMINHTLVWEAYAFSYDRVLPKLSFYQEALERHINTLSQYNVKKIIDIGCGTGNVTIPLLSSGCKVYAVDLSRAMLDHLRTKASDSYREKLFVFEQDACNLDQFATQMFDGVNVLLSLFDMNRPKDALESIIRVLGPKGLFIATEPKRTFRLKPLLRRAEEDLHKTGDFESLHRDWLRVSNANSSIDPSKRSPLFIEDIQSLLEERTFDIVSVTDSHLGNCATLVAIKPD